MPAYAKDPRSLDALVQEFRSLRARVGVLERQVANLRGAPTSSPGASYDANVIWNGGMESGLTGWRIIWHNGTSAGTLSIDNTNPIDGLQSLQVNEAAASNSPVYWCTGDRANPTVGTDVFATAPGEQWLVSAQVRSSISLAHVVLTASCGTAPADCYSIFGAQTFVTAADVPATAGTPVTVSGLITVPASRNYITVRPTVADTPGSAWFWEIDDVSLQKKL